ncbi:conjugative transfer ATPase [Cysteiniphilum litorale]|uniref:conjugative transfer ATPase n=1 Tax=Cysteiniphilum litorale TaxID=2056700 RepID=UPI003F8851E5
MLSKHALDKLKLSRVNLSKRNKRERFSDGENGKNIEEKMQPGFIRSAWHFVKDLVDFRGYESLSRAQGAFRLPPSFTRMMRIGDYDQASQTFYLTDNSTPVAMYEIKGLPTEGRTEDELREYEQKVFQILSVFPRIQQKQSPWTVQMYVKDEHDLSQLYEQVESGIDKDVRQTQLTQVFLKLFEKHCNYLSQKGGVYTDPNTGNRFSGKRRVTRLVFYRRQPKSGRLSKKAALKEITQLRQNIETQLAILMPYGVQFKRMSDKDYFLWMFNKFHLSKKGYARPSDYLKVYPFVEDEDARVHGYDIHERALSDPIESNDKEKWWKVGNTYHQYISAMGLTQAPVIGSVTAERLISRNFQAWFDGVPEGSEFHMSFNPISDFDIKRDMDKKEKSAKKSLEADAEKTLEEIKHFRREFVDKNYLYPTQMGCFIAAESLDQLEQNQNHIASALGGLSLEVMDTKYDVERLDKWFRFLPGNYDMFFDKEYRTAKLTSVRHIARMAPIGYGRASGSKNPLFVNFNRNGEAIMLHPILDRVNNSHKVTMGSTGAGKSVNIGEQIFNLMAILRPYLVVMDAGLSFEFLIDFMAELGLNVKKIIIKVTKGLPEVSLNPYAETQKMVQQYREMEALDKQVKDTIERRVLESLKKADEIQVDAVENSHEYDPESQSIRMKAAIEKRGLDETLARASKGEDVLDEVHEEAPEQRDYLAEFLSASLIIAGNGRDPEDAGFTDLHKRDLLEILVRVAKDAVDSGRGQMLPSNIRQALEEDYKKMIHSTDELEKAHAKRLYDLHAGFDTFLQSTLNKMYFDAPAKPLEDYDIIYFEMGLFKDDKPSNIAPRALAFISMVGQTMTACERRQYDKRDTVFFGDEIHIVTTNRVTAAPLVQCAKMARKIGLILWLATQDPEDFPDAAARMLAAFEFWEVLDFNNDETRKKIATMLGFSDQDLQLARSIRNAPKCHSEKVIISKKFRLLSRCIPQREIFALLANNTDEKERRRSMSRKYKCSEVVAALIQAQQMRGEAIDVAAASALIQPIDADSTAVITSADCVVEEDEKSKKDKKVTHDVA